MEKLLTGLLTVLMCTSNWKTKAIWTRPPDLLKPGLIINNKQMITNDKTQCLYCSQPTDDPHFVSDCCGRGMCDDCYESLRGTDEQWQLAFADDEDLERVKPEFRNATYLCFECTDIWKIKEKEYLFENLPEEIKDQVLMEASLITATEGDDLIEVEERAIKWIAENNYLKTIEHWQTRP